MDQMDLRVKCYTIIRIGRRCSYRIFPRHVLYAVRVNLPTVPHKMVRCIFSNLIPVQRGEKDAAKIEKRLTALLAASSGGRRS